MFWSESLGAVHWRLKLPDCWISKNLRYIFTLLTLHPTHCSQLSNTWLRTRRRWKSTSSPGYSISTTPRYINNLKVNYICVTINEHSQISRVKLDYNKVQYINQLLSVPDNNENKEQRVLGVTYPFGVRQLRGNDCWQTHIRGQPVDVEEKATGPVGIPAHGRRGLWGCASNKTGRCQQIRQLRSDVGKQINFILGDVLLSISGHRRCLIL